MAVSFCVSIKIFDCNSPKTLFLARFMHRLVLLSIFIISSLSATAQVAIEAFCVDTFAFINCSKNQIALYDTAAWHLFFNKLDVCTRAETASVSIVHIGDSHIQADFFSGELRRALHKNFGNTPYSRGLIFPYAVAGTNNPFNYKVQWQGDWQCKKAIEKDCTELGVTGISITTTDTLNFLSIKLCDNNLLGYEGQYLQMFADLGKNSFEPKILYPLGAEIVSVNRLEQSLIWDLKIYTDSVAIAFEKVKPEQQSFTLYGLNLFNSKSIEYHTIGINGARVSSYLRCSNFSNQLKALYPDLVIISLGTNDSYMAHFEGDTFYSQLEKMIAAIRTAQPNCAILLTSPGQNKIAGKTSNQNTFAATNFMLKIAQNQRCAIWNFNAIMESPEMIDVWYEAGLMRSDFVHFTRKGYELQAHLLFNAIMQLKSNLQQLNYQPNINE